MYYDSIFFLFFLPNLLEDLQTINSEQPKP